MSDGEVMARAHLAERFLPVLDEALAQVEAILVGQWKATTTDRIATREKLHDGVTMLPLLRGVIVQFIADGQVLKHSAEMAALLSPAAEDRR